MFVTLDRMKAEGYDVQRIDFQSPETMTLALQQGQVDIIGTSAGTVFSAIDAGFDGKAFLGMASSDFLMVARKDLTTCASLDGKRVAVQSREGTTGVLATQWFQKACPDAKPNILIVPGSENRVAGLIAGQLDASPIDSQNAAQLMNKRPSDFAPIASFNEGPQLLASVYFAPTAWLESHADLVKALTKTYTQVLHDSYADKSILLTPTKTLLSDMDPALVEGVVDSWMKRGVFVPVSGVKADTVDAAIKFYSSARPYKKIKTAADVATDKYVEGLSDR
jgi:ABC-type nitrate/sulfonate/bicarbonate transport system substrate-binding protein